MHIVYAFLLMSSISLYLLASLLPSARALSLSLYSIGSTLIGFGLVEFGHGSPRACFFETPDTPTKKYNISLAPLLPVSVCAKSLCDLAFPHLLGATLLSAVGGGAGAD
jgi:hypothetical protein